jgi:hypothetical protein
MFVFLDSFALLDVFDTVGCVTARFIEWFSVDIPSFVKIDQPFHSLKWRTQERLHFFI